METKPARSSRTKTFLVEASKEQFSAFLETLLSALELVPSMADGVHELANSQGPVALALAHEQRYVAAQYRVGTGVGEAFFVCPSAKSPQCGVRVASDEPPLWWLQFFGITQADPSQAGPSFLQLVCLLAGAGQITGNFVSDRALVLEQASEVDYLQALLREQSDELRRVKAALLLRQTPANSAPAPLGIESNSDRLIDLAELPTWCGNNDHRIVVLSRARKGAKKSLYEQPEHICEALELLAGPYRDHRLGLLSLKDFNDVLGSSSVNLEGSVSPSVAGEQGDAYFVSWGGRRRFLELHLLKGGGRNERYCMRVYFFWDEVSERVIVGDMPRHLENSLT